MSPGDTFAEVLEKIGDYASIGVKLIWVINPGTRTVYVYRSPTDVTILPESATIDGGDVLPGFAMLVAALFED